MGPLISHVIDMGKRAPRIAKEAAGAVYRAPGYLGKRGVDALETSTYNHLMRNAGDRAERIAQTVYMSPDFPKVKPETGGKLAADQALSMNRKIFDDLRDNTYQNLEARARQQAALVPGGLRFAGRLAQSPLAMTAYGVGGTLAAGNMLENQSRLKALQQMGLSPEEAEILTNELAMAAQSMESDMGVY